ncbi:MAG: hypothetical protein IPM38_09625 [Ignavibacteria bacterium]|nr:hypothetical protein [Ignavibacteria bacterium]
MTIRRITKRMVRTALDIHNKNKGRSVILVSKDVNLRMKAKQSACLLKITKYDCKKALKNCTAGGKGNS